MRALVKAHAEPGIWMQDVAEPEMGPNDVMVRVGRTAICGTDIHIFNWDDWASRTIPVPMTVGHEFVGVIADVGSEVQGFSVGDRVSGEGHVTCGYCRNCRAGRRHLCRNSVGVGVDRPGCFADYLAIPAVNAYRLPDDISDDIAAILDPLGNATHTALSFDLVGEDVLITGAGPIGLMAAAVCRHAGARHIVVTDLNDERLALAVGMGATRGVRADRENLDDVMRDLGMKEGFDVGLEMSGAAPALDAMIHAVICGAKVALLGLFGAKPEVDLNTAIFKGITFEGIYGRLMYETWHKMLAMLESGLDVSPVIPHRLAFEDFAAGFEAIAAGHACKVVLDLGE